MKAQRIFRFCAAFLTFILFSQHGHVVAQTGNRAVWRAQIRLTTGNVGDAGTDDSLRVKLNARNETWLDYAHNDHTRNTSFTYELLLNDIRTWNDITQIEIAKTGTDAWCLQSLELFINGLSVHVERTSSPSVCNWIDNGDGYSPIYRNRRPLRLFESGLVPLPPDYLERSALEKIIEGVIGHTIIRNPLYWGDISGRPVEVTRKDQRALHVDLDLSYDKDLSTDPEVDIDFDIRFGCNGNEVTVSAQNVKIEVGGSVGLTTLVGSIRPLITDSTQTVERHFRDVLSRATGTCNIRVIEGGTVLLK